jgi:hypothetical protein
MLAEPKDAPAALLLFLLRRFLRGLLGGLLLRLHSISPSSESPESRSGSFNLEIFKLFHKRIFPLTPIGSFDRYILASIREV